MSVAETSLSLTNTHHTARKIEQHYLLGLLLLTDALMLVLSFGISYSVRFSLNLGIFEDGTIKPAFYAAIVAVLVPGYLALFQICGLYNRAYLLGGTSEYARVVHAVTAGLLLIIFISFIQPEFVVARAWLLLAWGLMVALCIASRFSVRRLVYHLRHAGFFLDRTLVVGANQEGIAVAEQLVEGRTSGALIVGFIDDTLAPGQEPLPGLPVLGNSTLFNTLIDAHAIDTVVIANAAISRERLLNIYGSLDTLQDVEVRLTSGLFEMLTTSVRIREEACVPLAVLNKTRITGVHLLAKTLLDYLLVVAALVVLLPFFALIAILIKRDSPGPAFHRRRVIGQGKHEFDAFKFRTMYCDGDGRLTPEQQQQLVDEGKLKDDPRVTRIGAWLRRYSLDELPQLFNVLLGQMSLIGPRMITAPELSKFGRWQHNLATVKPGLTGLWQVSGRSELSYEERVKLDMHYIRNHSIWLDLQILFQTIPALISGRGAY